MAGKANGSAVQVVCLLLFVACAVATFASSHALAGTEVGLPGNNVDDESKLVLFPRLPTILGIQECWRSLLQKHQTCVASIFQLILTGNPFKPSSECCTAIRGLGNKCFPKMFSFLPFGTPISTGLIDGVCGASSPAAAPSPPTTL